MVWKDHFLKIFGTGYLVFGFTDKKRGLPDFIAGTVVIQNEQVFLSQFLVTQVIMIGTSFFEGLVSGNNPVSGNLFNAGMKYPVSVFFKNEILRIMTGESYQESAFSIALSGILHDNMDTPSGIATLGLFVVCFLDVLTTSLILSHGGFEMNPVMISVVSTPLLHILLKWCVVAFIAGVAAIADRMIPRAGILILGVIILWYTFVVSHNIMVLLEFFVQT